MKYVNKFEEFVLNEAKMKYKELGSSRDEYFYRVKNNDKTSPKGMSTLLKKVAKETKVVTSNLTHYTNNMNIYSDKEQDAIEEYKSFSSGAFEKINNGLRKGKLAKKWQNIADLLDSALLRLKLPNDLIIYRAMDNRYIAEIDKAFISTSPDPNTADVFNVGDNSEIFRFKIPKGTNYIFLGRNELEIIFPRGFNMTKHLDEKTD